MNTITVQLNDKQYDALMELLDYAMENLISDVNGLAKDDVDTSQQDEMLAQHEDLTKELISTKSYVWTDSYGRLQLDIAADHIDAISQPGDNEPAARAAIENDEYLKAQLELISEGASREFLADAGIEDVDSKSEEEVRLYLLWMACHDIAEERNQED